MVWISDIRIGDRDRRPGLTTPLVKGHNVDTALHSGSKETETKGATK
jgi:hypothetical protein